MRKTDCCDWAKTADGKHQTCSLLMQQPMAWAYDFAALKGTVAPSFLSGAAGLQISSRVLADEAPQPPAGSASQTRTGVRAEHGTNGGLAYPCSIFTIEVT
jgi:hypothetical protein